MRINDKQRKTINIAKYFKPEKFKVTDANLSYYQATDVVEDKSGISPEEAFLLRTDRGVKNFRVTNIKEYLELLIGHNGAARNVKMWSEGFREGLVFLWEFESEPDYIYELAKLAKEASKSDRYGYVRNLADIEFWKAILKEHKEEKLTVLQKIRNFFKGCFKLLSE